MYGRRAIRFVGLGLALWACATDPGNVKSAAASPADLVGSEWLAQRIGGVDTATGVRSSLRFEAVDRVSGDAACNAFHATLAVEGENVRLGPLATTRKMCPPPVMEQEQRFLQALGATRSLRLEGATLLLVDAGGSTLARLKRRESAARTVTGSIRYRERIALPPDAVVHVALFDVSRFLQLKSEKDRIAISWS